MLQCKLQIGNGELFCLLLRRELRPVDNLAVPEDVDCDKDGVCMACKDAAGFDSRLAFSDGRGVNAFQ
jgi:hypothetical protein